MLLEIQSHIGQPGGIPSYFLVAKVIFLSNASIVFVFISYNKQRLKGFRNHLKIEAPDLKLANKSVTVDSE